MAEDLEEALNDVSSATTNASSRASSFVSMLDEKDGLINPDQDLSGYDLDEDEEIPGVIIDNKPNPDLNKLVSLMDQKFVAKVDKNFFASREAHSKFDINGIANLELEKEEKKELTVSPIFSENKKLEILKESTTAYVPLRARKGKALPISISPVSSDQISPVVSSTFVPLRNRNASLAQIESVDDKADLVENIDAVEIKEIEMEKLVAETDKKVTFQDFLKINRKEAETESNVGLDEFIKNSNVFCFF